MWRKSPGPAAPIGLIAGQGDFPSLFATAAMSVKQPVILFGMEGYTDKNVQSLVSETHYIGLGELGRLTDLLTQKKIKRVVLAGGIPKKKIYDPSFKPDPAARNFMSGVQNKGDDHLLRAFSLFLRARCGVTVLDPRSILKEALAPKGVLTRRKPTESEKNDLRLGFRIAKHIGKMDIGQTVVIKDGVVLAVEAMEGTDQAIRRGGELGLGEAVVVKACKPNQDLRFDLPCIGTRTLMTMKELRSSVLGVEAGKTIFISRDSLIQYADKENMAIVGF